MCGGGADYRGIRGLWILIRGTINTMCAPPPGPGCPRVTSGELLSVSRTTGPSPPPQSLALPPTPLNVSGFFVDQMQPTAVPIHLKAPVVLKTQFVFIIVPVITRAWSCPHQGMLSVFASSAHRAPLLPSHQRPTRLPPLSHSLTLMLMRPAKTKVDPSC